jgi:hypothetical protein
MGTSVPHRNVITPCRYVDGGGLAEQQAALLHYQQDNLQYLSKEVRS